MEFLHFVYFTSNFRTHLFFDISIFSVWIHGEYDEFFYIVVNFYQILSSSNVHVLLYILKFLNIIIVTFLIIKLTQGKLKIMSIKNDDG